VFFFEKKNQKTFARLLPRKLRQMARPLIKAQEQKLFSSFFQKITLPSFRLFKA
jgi:hypothetical protein